LPHLPAATDDQLADALAAAINVDVLFAAIAE
jgi:hypothetical protein